MTYAGEEANSSEYAQWEGGQSRSSLGIGSYISSQTRGHPCASHARYRVRYSRQQPAVARSRNTIRPTPPLSSPPLKDAEAHCNGSPF